MKQLLILIVLTLFPLQHLLADDPSPVLNGWFAAQKNVQTWAADFTQTRTLKTLTTPLLNHGHVSFALPDDFRWELGNPPRTIAIHNSDQMYVVYPYLKRAELYPMGANAPQQLRAALSLLDAGFPKSRNEFDSEYQILSLTQTNGNYSLTLQPKSAAARQMMTQLQIGLSTNTFNLTSTELTFADGSTLRNDFTNIVLNPALDKTMFNWTPPADYQIVNPMAR
ncbi:MAG TPA: outer membrane lipoprotein carrier protein LolA [Verrucomicrobiae bacterium]|jgi:outer membrane lipoprotein-sorting protein